MEARRRSDPAARLVLGLAVVVAVVGLWPAAIRARFVVEKNSLRVTSPDGIRGTYDSAIGNFGIPQYGGSMAGNVVYPKDNQKGCKEFSDSGLSFQSKPGALPTFVLLDRGGPLFSSLSRGSFGSRIGDWGLRFLVLVVSGAF